MKEFKATSKHTDLTITSLFSIWRWKLSSDKLLPYDTVCKVLGVQLDFKMSGERLTLVSNTVDGVTELCEAIDSVLSSGTLKRSDGERLRGRLLFASGQLFGRKIRNLIRIVSKHIHSGRKIMGDETTDALKLIKKYPGAQRP